MYPSTQPSQQPPSFDTSPHFYAIKLQQHLDFQNHSGRVLISGTRSRKGGRLEVVRSFAFCAHVYLCVCAQSYRSQCRMRQHPSMQKRHWRFSGRGRLLRRQTQSFGRGSGSSMRQRRFGRRTCVPFLPSRPAEAAVGGCRGGAGEQGRPKRGHFEPRPSAQLRAALDGDEPPRAVLGPAQ